MKTFYTKEKILTIKADMIKAAEKLYKQHGYEYVNLLNISKLTHLSRPAIYNYYHSKEEIFLDILLREYNSFGARLKKKLTIEKLTKDELADELADIILKHVYLLEFISSYENNIEENSTIEHLKEYRTEWDAGFYTDFMAAISFQFPEATQKEKDEFLDLFIASLYGIYPIICPSEERVAAMKERGRYREVDARAFISKTMKLLLTNID